MLDKAGRQVQLKKKNITRRDLKEMSECDMEVMDAVWNEFGHLDQWEIRDYTHTHCAEWEDPGGSSLPINHLRGNSAGGGLQQKARQRNRRRAARGRSH
ncbi:MAG: DUF4065 domain-containing protein [Gammaproteobacteria bacterium]|nr:DUF4065 domain-containing protein [Gammaproteobacteria bacterium]MDD9815748.1 DUF4065 domain-containing protein [Gammaproteobacteria bacterium]